MTEIKRKFYKSTDGNNRLLTEERKSKQQQVSHVS